MDPRSDHLPSLRERLEVVIEVPRFSPVKRRPDGRVHFVAPVPSPFNYGSVVGSALSADGDPLDALVLGPRLRRGARRRLPVLGIVAFVDAGADDPKVVLGLGLSPRERRRIESFFRRYAVAKRLMSRFRGRTAYDGWLLEPSFSPRQPR